ncbi:MAG: chemotaxis protein CheX [Zoogloeaceae bacterium]|jgi:chemotaxis protein CheX|nr:chemotaxis protein CheX [Zoogloeaceae bacterium]
MSDISEQDIHVFVDAISHYFTQITREKAKIKGAFLAQGEKFPPTFDLTGIIKISGKFRGSVYFSAPRVMLSRLLLSMHESHLSDEQLLDAVGEIANTVAGNARKYFGENMGISVPKTMSTPPKWSELVVRARPYVIMINWKQYDASVVIDIERLD